MATDESSSSPSQLPTLFSFLALILTLFPLYWQLKAKRKNIPALSLTFWLAQQNLGQGINTVIWRDNVIVKYAVWCEICEFLFLPLVFMEPVETQLIVHGIQTLTSRLLASSL